jgi:hypothetical protein
LTVPKLTNAPELHRWRIRVTEGLNIAMAALRLPIPEIKRDEEMRVSTEEDFATSRLRNPKPLTTNEGDE